MIGRRNGERFGSTHRITVTLVGKNQMPYAFTTLTLNSWICLVMSGALLFTPLVALIRVRHFLLESIALHRALRCVSLCFDMKGTGLEQPGASKNIVQMVSSLIDSRSQKNITPELSVALALEARRIVFFGVFYLK